MTSLGKQSSSQEILAIAVIKEWGAPGHWAVKGERGKRAWNEETGSGAGVRQARWVTLHTERSGPKW